DAGDAGVVGDDEGQLVAGHHADAKDDQVGGGVHDIVVGAALLLKDAVAVDQDVVAGRAGKGEDGLPRGGDLVTAPVGRRDHGADAVHRQLHGAVEGR